MGNPDHTRQKILEVAYQLFVEQGYQGTSLSQIIEKTGLSKGAIYYHFSSKEDLFQSAFVWKVQNLVHLLHQVTLPDPQQRAEKRFYILTQYLFDHRDDLHRLGLHTQNLPPRLRRRTLQSLSPLFEEIVNLFVEPLSSLHTPYQARMFTLFSIGALHFSLTSSLNDGLLHHFETYWKVFRKFLRSILFES